MGGQHRGTDHGGIRRGRCHQARPPAQSHHRHASRLAGADGRLAEPRHVPQHRGGRPVRDNPPGRTRPHERAGVLAGRDRAAAGHRGPDAARPPGRRELLQHPWPQQCDPGQHCSAVNGGSQSVSRLRSRRAPAGNRPRAGGYAGDRKSGPAVDGDVFKRLSRDRILHRLLPRGALADAPGPRHRRIVAAHDSAGGAGADPLLRMAAGRAPSDHGCRGADLPPLLAAGAYRRPRGAPAARSCRRRARARGDRATAPAADRCPGTRGGHGALPAVSAEAAVVARGSLVNLAAMITGAVLGFGLTVLVSRWLQPSGAGALFELIALFTILSNTFELGADTGLIRWISRARAIGGLADVRRIVGVALAPVLIIGIGAAAAMWVTAPELARLFLHGMAPGAGAADIRIVAPLVPLGALSSCILDGARGFGRMW